MASGGQCRRRHRLAEVRSSGVRQGRAWLSPPDPTFDILGFNFDTDTDLLVKSSPVATNSNSLDIKQFIKHNGKIIWYHGLSDPGPPVLGTINYYNELAAQHGGLRGAAEFSRFYPIPNMGHCVNAGEKMRQRAGVKLHHGWVPERSSVA